MKTGSKHRRLSDFVNRARTPESIGRSVLPILACALALVLGQPIAAAQRAADRNGAQTSVDIPAGPLNRSILAISDAFGVDVLAPSELVAEKSAPAVLGATSAKQALNTVLAGSGLEFHATDGAFVISETKVRKNSPREREDSKSGSEVEETIIVQGTKQNLSVQEASASVQVLKGETLDQNAIYQLNDAFFRTPNVTTSGSANFLTIRGIGRFGIGIAGQGVTSNIYQDGVPKAAGPLGLDSGSVWDVEQVEILRGPQSTIQGRNSLAGAVVITTKDPAYDWEFGGRIRAAEFGQRQFAGVVSGPIIDDQVAFRVAADYQESDGFLRNAVTEMDDNFSEVLVLRNKLLFEPTALDGLRSELIFEYTDVNRGIEPAVVNAPVPADDPAFLEFDPNDRVSFGRPTGSELGIFRYIADTRYEFNDALALQSLVTLESYDQSTITGTQENILDFGLLEDFEGRGDTFSAELRLEFESGPVSGFVGGYYFREEIDNFSRFSTVLATQVPFPIRPAESLGIGSQPFASDIENYALYSQVRWELSRDVVLDLGLRFDREEFQTTGIGVGDTVIEPATCEADVPGSVVGTEDEFVTLPCQEIVDLIAPPVDNPLQANVFDTLLPRATLTYRVAKDVDVFASYQRGYRAGGTFVQATATGALVGTYEPEFLDNFELGYRSQFLSNRLTANGNFFYSRLTDQQVAIPGPTGNVRDFRIANAGESEIYGAEISFNYLATIDFELYADFGLLEAEFVDFPFASTGLPFENLGGTDFPSSPAFTMSLGGNYRHSTGAFVSANISHQSPTESSANVEGLTEADLAPGVNERIPARTLINGRLGYEFGPAIAFIYVQNLLDERALVDSNVASVIPATGQVSFLPIPFQTIQIPRTVGLGLDFGFTL
ncbi:MAG: TonB-dependent receptor [Myxococcota bacterium]